MIRRHLSRPAAVLVLVLAIALAAVGWGHRAPQTGEDEAALRFQAYWLAGGDTADLCGTGPAAATKAPCDACRLTDAPGQPDPGNAVARAPDAVDPPVGGPSRVTDPMPCHPAWFGRAPPVV